MNETQRLMRDHRYSIYLDENVDVAEPEREILDLPQLLNGKAIDFDVCGYIFLVS